MANDSSKKKIEDIKDDSDGARTEQRGRGRPRLIRTEEETSEVVQFSHHGNK